MEGYDASFALDEIQFLDCDLPQWEEDCPEEFHCANGVRTYDVISYMLTHKTNSYFYPGLRVQ